MPRIAYTVKCQIRNPDLAEKWLEWMKNEHIADVLAAGANDAELIKLESLIDPSVSCFEVRYHFENKDAYDAYLKNHAPTLRQKGMDKFPVDEGLVYSRTAGECLE